MANPTFDKRVGGKLAVDRYDFKNHLEGINPSPSQGSDSFRHKANQIDMANPGLAYGNPSTVEQALDNLGSFVNFELNAGTGFICVPDGYDTYWKANGVINFDPTIPSLDTFLNPIFNAIIAGTPLPAQYSRIQHGGTILIKAGTYIVVNTINVPPGITLIGEGYGTKIINATSLDLSVMPPIPKGITTQAPLFLVKTDPNRSANDNVIDSSSYFMFGRETIFKDMVIADNFVEPTTSTDVFYKLPQNYNNYPLISQETGSSLTFDNVKFDGRVTLSTNQATCFACALPISLSPSTNGSMLRVKNCFIDGFSIPIYFTTLDASVHNNFLELTNNKIRAYGYFAGIGGLVAFNSIIFSQNANITATSNFFYGNNNNILAGIFISNTGQTVPNLQNRLKINITGNSSIIKESSNTINTTYNVVKFDTFTPTISTFYSTAIANNSFQGQGPTALTNNIIGPATYTIDGTVPDDFVLLSSAAGVITINLPPASANVGRILTFKDDGSAGSHNTIIQPFSGDYLEGTLSPTTITVASTTFRIISSGGINWWKI